MSQIRKSTTTLPKSTSNVKTNDKKSSPNVQVVLSKVNKIITDSSSFIDSTDLNKMKTTYDKVERRSSLVEIISSDQIDEMKFYSACNLENLKTHVKNTKINLFSSNGNTSEDGLNSTSEQSLTDREESSPKYNTRSNRINNQNQQKISPKKLKQNELKNMANDAAYLKKLDDNTTSSNLNDDYDSEISNISQNAQNHTDYRSRIRTRRRTSTPHANSKIKINKNKPQVTTINNENSTKRALTSNSSRSSSSRSSSSAEMKNKDSECLPECGKAHCRLGCICEALQVTGNVTNSRGSISSNSGSSTSGGGSSSNNLVTRKNNSITNNHTTNSLNSNESNVYRDHCGRFECMFECTCTRRLRSTTRNVRRSSNNSDNNTNNKSPNDNIPNAKTKKNPKKPKPNRTTADTAPSTSKKSRGTIEKVEQRFSSQSSTRSSSSKDHRSSTRSSLNHNSSDEDSNKEENSSESDSSVSCSSSSSAESCKEGVSKVRKSKRVKHLIKKAAASSSRSNKKSHHSSNQKFEDNYYYYYANNHQLTSKNNIKSKSISNNSQKTLNELDSHEETNSFPGQVKKSPKNEQSSRNQQKHKLSKMLKKLNKKGPNNQQEDIAEAFEKLANLKKVSSFRKTSTSVKSEFEYHEMEEIALGHNGDNKENFKKEIDSNFKPYNQNITLHIELKSSDNSISQNKSMPIHIEILTSKWCEKISRKVLRLISKLLQRLDTFYDPIQPQWKELEFDYENEITIKMASSSRVPIKKAKIDEISDIVEYAKPISLLILRCKRETNVPNLFSDSIGSKTKQEQNLVNSVSDLISLHGNGTSILIDFKTHELMNIQTKNGDTNISLNKNFENDNVLRDSSKTSSFTKHPLTPAKTILYSPSNIKASSVNPNRYRPILPASSPSKCLPRLLCRNRSFNDTNSTTTNKRLNLNGSRNSETPNQNLNQTGIIFKKVDKLFEKIKSSPLLDQTTANLLSKMASFSYSKHTKISSKLLDFRPKSNLTNALLYKDEQIYFKNSKKTSYEFYDPFSDKNLILDLYNKPNYTRDFVDTVCTVVNNMVNVISIANNDKALVNNTSGSYNKNNNKLITSESFPKPNKTVTILPKPSNMAVSNTQAINNNLSKPSVIIINNNNSQNLNVNISPGSMSATSSNIISDLNTKIQNPFITAIKSNFNCNVQLQHQLPPNDLQSKTIVKCN